MKLGEAYVQLEMRMGDFEKKLKSAETKTISSTDKMGASVAALSKNFLRLAGVAGLGAVGLMVRRLFQDASQFNREALALSKTLDMDLSTATSLLRDKIREQSGAWGDLRIQLGLLLTDAIAPATEGFGLLAQKMADAIAEKRKFDELNARPGGDSRVVGGRGYIPRPLGAGWASPESENAQFLPAFTEKQAKLLRVSGARYSAMGAQRDALGNIKGRQLGMDMSRPAGAGLGGAMSMLNIDETVGDMNRTLKEQLKQEERAYLDDIKKMNREYWHWELEQARITAEKKFDVQREYIYKLQQILHNMSSIPGIGKYLSFAAGIAGTVSSFMETKSLLGSMGGSGGLPEIKSISPMPGLDGPGVGSMGKSAVYIDLRNAVTNTDQLMGILNKVAVGAVVRDARNDGVTRQMFTTRQ